MIINNFRHYDFKTALVISILSLFIIVFSLSFHEFSHAAVAYMLGDPTAKDRGRLTLNPLKHLNLMGFVCMLLVGFGWADPVPINPNYFKRRKGGMALSAFAGPVANLLLSFISLLLENVVYLAAISHPEKYTAHPAIFEILVLFFTVAHQMNLYLAIFNLIPVPPLDGSRILFIFLPAKYYFKFMKYEQYIAIGLIILLYVGVLDGPLSFIVSGISGGMQSLINLIL